MPVKHNGDSDKPAHKLQHDDLDKWHKNQERSIEILFNPDYSRVE